MKRPLPLRVESKVKCQDCGKMITATYEVVHKDDLNLESVSMACLCGYVYSSHGSYRGTK